MRERLGIRPGDELQIQYGEEGLCLEPDHPGLITVISGKSDWGPEAFPDAGAATFGGRPRTEE